jgi:hypothetical protein
VGGAPLCKSLRGIRLSGSDPDVGYLALRWETVASRTARQRIRDRRSTHVDAATGSSAVPGAAWPQGQPGLQTGHHHRSQADRHDVHRHLFRLLLRRPTPTNSRPKWPEWQRANHCAASRTSEGRRRSRSSRWPARSWPDKAKPRPSSSTPGGLLRDTAVPRQPGYRLARSSRPSRNPTRRGGFADKEQSYGCRPT